MSYVTAYLTELSKQNRGVWFKQAFYFEAMQDPDTC